MTKNKKIFGAEKGLNINSNDSVYPFYNLWEIEQTIFWQAVRFHFFLICKSEKINMTHSYDYPENFTVHLKHNLKT